MNSEYENRKSELQLDEKKLVSIIVPVYNEEEVLELFYKETCAVIDQEKLFMFDFEFLFINDGSTDKTQLILLNLRKNDTRVTFVNLSRNFGKEIALSCAFDNINKISDAIVIMDADLQDPPKLIIKMLEEWQKDFDDVYAKRVSRKGESLIKRTTSYFFYRLLSFFSDFPIQKDTGDFRLLNRKAFMAIQQMHESQRYTKGLFSWIGFDKKEIEFDREERKAGETKWNYLNLINLAIEGITSSTTKPLRVASMFGFIVSIFAFVWLIKVFIKTVFFGEAIQGYPSLMIVVLFLGGIQLLSLGLIGEYLGRVFKETKNRPLYFIKEKQVNHSK